MTASETATGDRTAGDVTADGRATDGATADGVTTADVTGDEAGPGGVDPAGGAAVAAAAEAAPEEGRAPAPGPRVLLVTGPGGDGATTVAAATALAAARQGQTTLLLSAEPPARLATLLGEPPPAWPEEPARWGPVDVARIDAGRVFRERLLGLQSHVTPALDALGAAPLDDDELTELPGSHALALHQTLRAAHAAGRWELLVVDVAPVAEALRILALPEQLGRYLRRLLPPERLAARALRPILAQLAGVPLPGAGLLDAAGRLDAELAAARAIVTGPGTAVRLVIDPGSGRSLATTRAARAGLALHGLPLEAVTANRMIPATPGLDPWLSTLAERQWTALREFVDAVGVPRDRVHSLPHLGREAGPAQLRHLAGMTEPPAAAAHREEPALLDRLTEDGLLVWRLPLPGSVRDELGLVRRGDELVVTTGPFRRVLPLPSALRRCTVAGAALEEDGTLAVRFRPDPAQWPADGGRRGGAGERAPDGG
ncbi:ArsA family ATPase [Streptomyces sp. 4N509B]|uniref:ArsA family ATPase n=1 Tax=Streptomyces sp. 4N509B TaxID=3457413 RepID=UPI003FD42E3A